MAWSSFFETNGMRSFVFSLYILAIYEGYVLYHGYGVLWKHDLWGLYICGVGFAEIPRACVALVGDFLVVTCFLRRQNYAVAEMKVSSFPEGLKR